MLSTLNLVPFYTVPGTAWNCQIAKLKGRYKGKQSRFNNTDIQKMKEHFVKPGINKSELARGYGITRQHLYRLVAA